MCCPAGSGAGRAGRISSLRCLSPLLAKKQMQLSALMTDALGCEPYRAKPLKALISARRTATPEPKEKPSGGGNVDYRNTPAVAKFPGSPCAARENPERTRSAAGEGGERPPPHVRRPPWRCPHPPRSASGCGRPRLRHGRAPAAPGSRGGAAGGSGSQIPAGGGAWAAPAASEPFGPQRPQTKSPGAD